MVSVAETRADAPDADVLKVADADGRILITEDRDFGEMVIRQHLGVCGMILLELDRLTNAAEAERWQASSRPIPIDCLATLS